MNAGISVSRVGGAAQIPAMKKTAGGLRINLAQYRELAAFAQFGSDLDKATQAQLAKGERLTEVLKQDQYEPLPVEKQVAIIFAANEGFLDDLEPADCRDFETGLYEFLETRHPDTLARVREERKLDDALTAALRDAIADFRRDAFRAGGAAGAPAAAAREPVPA